MQPPIVVRYVLNLEHFLDIQEAKKGSTWLERHSRLPRPMAIAGGVVGALLMLLFARDGWSSRGGQLGLTLVSVATAQLLQKPAMNALLYRMVRQAPGFGGWVVWEVEEDSMTMVNEAAEARWGWGVFARVVRTPIGFLLFSKPINYWLLPFDGFDDPSDIRRFDELARARVADFATSTEPKVRLGASKLADMAPQTYDEYA